MPPPPPPAPPPLPKQPFGAPNSQGKSNNCEPPPDRNALLSQIRKGARLKKAETNDRSTPLIEGNRSSNTATKRNADTKSNGPFPIIPPGGLFAQGIPKLRPTTPRSDNNSNPPLAMVIQSIKQGNTGSSLRVSQLSGSRSQPPSPVSKPRTTPVSTVRTVNSENNENSNISSGNPNFPDDITIKGPAPAPPPQSQKPVFRSTTNTESNISVKHSTVKRSASQTNLQRPRLARPPPSEKPPPPPKSNPTPPQNAPPPPPSKPPNIMRRQSFGVGESHSSRFASNKLSVANNATPKSYPKVIGPPPPPPPPRNNSAPNDLNQMIMSSSPGNQLVKMLIAPPPPPNRGVAPSMRSAPVRPPPPRAPAPPPPPPPPQHQFPVHPAPPSQLKALPTSNLAPPPPARVSSIKLSASDFEDRFRSMFCSAQSLPKPDVFTNFQKSYPSRLMRQKQNTRRQPPPPPPQVGGGLNDRSRSQPVIPVQYDSGIFSGNYDHS